MRRSCILLVSILTMYVILAVGTALTRQPYSDEGELASPAYTLIHRGYMAVIPWEDYRDSHRAYWMPPVFFLVEAAWQSIVGFGVVQFRLVSVLSGLAVLGSVYFIVEALTSERTLALVVTGILGLDYTFLQHAGIGRCEALSLAFGVGALAAYLKLRPRSLPWAIVSGHSLMAGSALTHPVGVLLWMPALLGLQAYLDLKRHTVASVLLTALPYVVGGAGWGVYILGNPAEFRRQFLVSLSMGRMSGFQHPLLGVKREVTERFLAYYGLRSNASALVRLKMILPVGYLVGITCALLIPPARRYRFLQLATVLFAIQFLILAVGEGTKQFQYIVYIIPTLDAVLGTLVWLAWQERWLPRPLLAVGVTALLVMQIGPTLFRIHEDRYRQQFVPVLEYIRPYVERKELVLSQAEFAIPLGFPDNVITDPSYGWRRLQRPRLMVVDEAVMEKNTEGARGRAPILHRYLAQELPAEYEPVFARGQYVVYQRR